MQLFFFFSNFIYFCRIFLYLDLLNALTPPLKEIRGMRFLVERAQPKVNRGHLLFLCHKPLKCVLFLCSFFNFFNLILYCDDDLFRPTT